MSKNTSTNYMRDLIDFMDAWDNPDRPDNTKSVDLCFTEFGNINSTGIVGDYRGHALTRWHPQFYDSVEPMVRELVRLLVEKFDWITYSSCQGHLYSGLSEEPIERNVGLVPRTDHENESIRGTMQGVFNGINSRFSCEPTFLELWIHTLDGEGIVRPALDIRFRRRDAASWELYFDCLEKVYTAVLNALVAVKL